MLLKKTIYNFPKKFRYYINLKNLYIYIYNERYFFFLKLPSFYFVKYMENSISFIFVNYFNFISFLRLLISYVGKLYSLYYAKLKLRGLGYRMESISKDLLKLFFTKNDLIYLHIPKGLIVKYLERQIFFVSYDLNVIKKIMISFSLLRKLSAYELKGFFYPNKIIRMKPGKVKIR